RGDVLLAGGTQLTDAFIASIRQRGYQFVYIMDGIADDVEPRGLISQRLRSTTVRNLDGVFALIAQASKGTRDAAAEEGADVLAELSPRLGGAVERQIGRLEADVEQLLN